MASVPLSRFIIFVILLFVGSVFSSRLVFVDKSNNEEGKALHVKLAQEHDVRGDYGNFLLVVDHGNFFGDSNDNVIFSHFDVDDIHFSYFVVEIKALSLPVHLEFPTNLDGCEAVYVRGKYVVAVPKSLEDHFAAKMPYGYESVLVSKSPLSAPTEGNFENLFNAPDPKISSFINQVNSNDIKAFVTYLSGESSSIITRQAQSTGAVSAQNYLVQQFSSFGFTATTQAFRSGYSSNVVARLQGTSEPKRIVIVSSHYDSRGPALSSVTDRAPGANDNGSGTGALLQIAKLISANKISFAYTVVLIAFSGEEQGLYGSAYSAQQFKNEGADIVAVLNADMIAYRSPNESPQLAFVSRSATLTLNTLLTNISKTYVTGLTIGTSTGCCTDHSSFYNQGFPATSFFERNGAIADPQYHKAGDLVNREGYDLQTQYPLIVKSMFASLLTIAKYN